MSMIIEGMNRDEHKKLFEAIEKAGGAYGIKKIKVNLVKDGFVIGIGINSLSVSEDASRILSKSELEAAISHEFSHLVHHDPVRDMAMAIPLIAFAIAYSVLAHYFTDTGLNLYLWLALIILALAYLALCVLALHRWDRRSDREAARKTGRSAMLGYLERRSEHVKGIDLLHPSISKRIKWLREDPDLS